MFSLEWKWTKQNWTKKCFSYIKNKHKTILYSFLAYLGSIIVIISCLYNFYANSLFSQQHMDIKQQSKWTFQIKNVVKFNRITECMLNIYFPGLFGSRLCHYIIIENSALFRKDSRKFMSKCPFYKMYFGLTTNCFQEINLSYNATKLLFCLKKVRFES